VVMNNGEYRTLKQTLDENGSRSTARGAYVGLDLAPPRLDWASVARSFGVAAIRVGSAEELREAVARVPELTGPLLIETPVRGHGH